MGILEEAGRGLRDSLPTTQSYRQRADSSPHAICPKFISHHSFGQWASRNASCYRRVEETNDGTESNSDNGSSMNGATGAVLPAGKTVSQGWHRTGP